MITTIHHLFVLSQAARGKIETKTYGTGTIITPSFQNTVRELHRLKLVVVRGGRVVATEKGLGILDEWCRRIWPEAMKALMTPDTEAAQPVTVMWGNDKIYPK